MDSRETCHLLEALIAEYVWCPLWKLVECVPQEDVFLAGNPFSSQGFLDRELELIARVNEHPQSFWGNEQCLLLAIRAGDEPRHSSLLCGYWVIYILLYAKFFRCQSFSHHDFRLLLPYAEKSYYFIRSTRKRKKHPGEFAC